MPVCFAMVRDEIGAPCLYTPIDEKPKKSGDPRQVARLRDVEARPEVAVLVDRWDEDWSRLAWLRLEGTASVLWAEGGSGRPTEGAAGPPADRTSIMRDAAIEADERRTAIALLRARYPQYVNHDLESRPLIRIVVTRVVAWGATDGA